SSQGSPVSTPAPTGGESSRPCPVQRHRDGGQRSGRRAWAKVQGREPGGSMAQLDQVRSEGEGRSTLAGDSTPLKVPMSHEVVSDHENYPPPDANGPSVGH